jgi:hypothetical protein
MKFNRKMKRTNVLPNQMDTKNNIAILNKLFEYSDTKTCKKPNLQNLVFAPDPVLSVNDGRIGNS